MCIKALDALNGAPCVLVSHHITTALSELTILIINIIVILIVINLLLLLLFLVVVIILTWLCMYGWIWCNVLWAPDSVCGGSVRHDCVTSRSMFSFENLELLTWSCVCLLRGESGYVLSVCVLYFVMIVIITQENRADMLMYQ